jgi:hypothetical protein
MDLCTLADLKAWLGIGQVSEAGTIPAAPGPYTVTVAKAAAWTGDGGVVFALTGVPLVKVAAAPAAGQYAVAAGVYTFNAADAAKQVTINYTVTSPDDALLARLISALSAAVVKELPGVALASGNVNETRDGHGGSRLMLRQAPVTGVSSITVDGTAIPAATGPLVSGFVFDGLSITLRGYAFTLGVQNVELSYTAGYAAVPADLAQAVIEWAALRYKEREHIGQTSKALGDGQTVAYWVKDMPEFVRRMLDNYRRVAPV